MSQKVIRFCLALVALSPLGALAGETARTPSADLPTVISRLDDRSTWVQVNKEPYYVTSVVNVLCAAPTTARVEDERKRNPHASTAINVFVNEIGVAAMLSKEPAVFPVGSMIVKQKFDPKNEPNKPLLYTVMTKRESGFNPDAGDWEFAVLSGDGRDVQAQGNLANCVACHQPQKANDYVFKSYLGH